MPSIKAGLIPAGTLVLRFLPRGAALVLASIVAEVWFRLGPTAGRRAVEQNLARLVAGAGPRERRRLARATFRHFAAVWVDFLRLPLLTRRTVSDLVCWETRAHLDAALEQRRGVVLVSPHVGALDLAGVYLAALGYPISVVVEDIEPSLYRVWRRYRESTGMRVLSRRRGAIAVYRALRRGEIVALVADRLIEGPGLEVDFGGGRRVVPIGPAAFARKAQSPIVVMRIARESRGSGYDLVTEAAIAPSDTTEGLTRTIAAHLARLIQGHPDQWFVFQSDWLDADRGRTVTVPIPRLIDSDAR
jgi:lauroyl/myristoyl acyltransferase